MRRDLNNKILGGVCSGIAKSTGLPTLLVRLAFIFGTLWLGGGVLIYLILWLLIPAETTGILENFKLERDEANGMIGGVCAGISIAIGMNVTIMRLLWLISVFYFGFGLIPYLILWILMPKKTI
jgi:phage shock protein PspC (stress-responsive transcriptional regulator)